jgi:hypothetical protein
MTRRHELDPISLTFGLLFTGLGLLFLIGQADQALRLKWVWPLLLLAIGAAILLDVTRGRDRNQPQAEPEVEPQADPEPAPEPVPALAEPDPEGPVDNPERRS